MNKLQNKKRDMLRKMIVKSHNEIVEKKAKKGYIHSGFGDRFVGKRFAK